MKVKINLLIILLTSSIFCQCQTSSEKVEYEDFPVDLITTIDKRISDGNDIGSLNEAANLYTDEGEMGVGPGGQVVFWNGNKNEYENYSSIQKPFLKDFKAVDPLVQAPR